VEADPRETVTRQWLAYADEGRTEDAERLVRSALERWPDDAELHYLLASSIVDRPENADEVVALAHAMARLAPDDAFVLMQASTLLMYVRELEYAETYVQRAIEVAPMGWEFAAELAYTAGTVLAHLHKDEEAEGALRAAYHLDPEGVGHGKDLAAIVASQGRLSEALEIADDALQHRPDDEVLKAVRDRIAADFAERGDNTGD
jgi:tetratricopeptide (TPR) repeat protein